MKNRYASFCVAVLLLTRSVPAFAVQTDRETATTPAEASQFDYLLGHWDFTATYTFPDTTMEAQGVWSARKTHEGFAVTDEWRLIDDDGTTMFLIATFRAFDPRLEKWVLQSLDVYDGKWTEQYAVYRDGEMHLNWSGTDRFGSYMMRVRYYDIERNRFSWIADRSYDGGTTWIEGWLAIEATRRTQTPSR